MGPQRSLLVHNRTVAWSLAFAAVELLLLALFVAAVQLRWLEPGRLLQMVITAALLPGPTTTLVLALPRWSRRSHLLAVGHGMIPKHSAAWAGFGWLVPVANLVVPFAMLRDRWRFYGCRGSGPISPVGSAQALCGCAALALWFLPRIEAVLLVGIWAAAGLLELRRAVVGVGTAQVLAEQEAHAEQVFG